MSRAPYQARPVSSRYSSSRPKARGQAPQLLDARRTRAERARAETEQINGASDDSSELLAPVTAGIVWALYALLFVTLAAIRTAKRDI